MIVQISSRYCFIHLLSMFSEIIISVFPYMLQTYCGFYKHQIEANLVGAEIMFEIMGYKHYSNGVLILEGPICPDTVTNVSKDCLIAYVECQVKWLH